jgi:hypothetical protein
MRKLNTLIAARAGWGISRSLIPPSYVSKKIRASVIGQADVRRPHLMNSRMVHRQRERLRQ